MLIVGNAINYLQQALKQDDKNYETLIALSKAYDKKKSIDQAIEYAEKAILVKSDETSLLYLVQNRLMDLLKKL